MKKIIFLLAFCLPVFLNAQNKEGKIIYNEKTNIKIELPDDMKQHAKNMPSGAESKMQLFFNENESLYKEAPKEEEAPEVDPMQSGFQMKIMGANQNSLIYYNRTEGQKLESKDLFGKQFLINSKPEEGKWKMTGEQKTVAGYNCMSAEMTEPNPRKEGETITTKAWFAPEIPHSIGPGNFQGLPGAILEVHYKQNSVEVTITAAEIVFAALENAIEKPSEGKEVTEEEFEEVSAKKMKEIEKMYGGEGRDEGGGRRVRITTN